MRRVAIIGGGPGGAQCAAALATHGFDVTLFEPRSRFEKPCGGGIPARGLEAFPFLGDSRLPVRAVSGCVVIAPSGDSAEIPLEEPLYIFSRADLHHFMLDRAERLGVHLLRLRVADFRRCGDRGWSVTTAPSSAGEEGLGPYDFLVAADGAAGAARRRLTGGLPTETLTQGIGYYMPGLHEDVITLKYFEGLEGYLWVFPRTDHSSAGICAPLGSIPAAGLKERMDRFLIERYGGDLLARSERYAALIPAAPAVPLQSPLSGADWALVGDSGRAVDPLTREGIYFAMLAGDRLARALAAGRLEDYARGWALDPGRELAWAARHAAGFFDARFIERLVSLCRRSPIVARVLSELIGGRQSYRSLKLRLLMSAPAIAWQVARGRDGRTGGGRLTPARDS